MSSVTAKIISLLHLEAQKESLMIRLGLRKDFFDKKTNEIINLYKDIVKPGMLVYDIGANQGHYTAAFLKLGAKVISVEPQKNCFKILKLRFGNNPNVQLINCALDGEAGEKSIHVSNMNTISSMAEDWIEAVKESNRFPGAEWSKTEIIKTTTLQSLIDKYGKPDYVKIDVEGYELNVLKGLHSKVPLISLEYTGEVLQNTFQCLDYLKTLGEIRVFIEQGGGSYANQNDWIKADEAVKLLSAADKKSLNSDLYVKFIA